MIDLHLRKDIETCLSIINNDYDNILYTGKLYRNTNEILINIIREDYIKDKKVLSVMASGDQVFSAYYRGAKKVDTFDVNILAYYFFFLKKWTYMLTHKHYIPADNKIIKQCLKMHNNTEEELRAYYFWEEIINNLDQSLYYSPLFYPSKQNWNVPYQNDDYFDVDNIKPNFYEMNIFKQIPDIGPYDVIILSNILEYMYQIEDEKKYYDTLFQVIYNLRKLLVNGGIDISSNILDTDYSNNSIIDKYFEYEEGTKGYSVIIGKDIPLYYTLKKRF